LAAHDGPLVAWCSDDMTGSVDVLDALLLAGVRGALFVDAPSEADLARVGDVGAIGVAGMTRTLPTAALRETLRPLFARLAATGAPLLHYKVCSTFDSSPQIGSIGAALDLLEELLAPPVLPLLAAAPRLGRYTVFGNHFARSGSAPEVYRLDRHPTMRTHPVTPMDEADLRIELARQTALPLGHVSALAIGAGAAAARNALDAALADGARVVVLDALDDAHMATIGELLWERATAAGPLPVVGSAGVEHALAAHWRASGLAHATDVPAYAAADGPILALAGSRSPVTDVQIARAVADGFVEIAPPLEDLLAGDARALEVALPAALDALADGRSALVHSAGAPIAAARQERRLAAAEARRLGAALGAVAEAVLDAGAATRVAVAGGDTSGDVVRRLGVVALEALAPFGPAMPLCRATAPGRAADGAELIFKGGQTGTVDFFGDVLRDQPTLDKEHVT
jgi:3-oxoisoapionate kinase